MQLPSGHQPPPENQRLAADELPTRSQIRQLLSRVSSAATLGLAIRCALRVLPLAIDQTGRFPKSWTAEHALAPPRAIVAAIEVFHGILRKETASLESARSLAKAASGRAFAAADAADDRIVQSGTSAAAYAASTAAYDSAKNAATAATCSKIHLESSPSRLALEQDLRADLAWISKNPHPSLDALLRFMHPPSFGSDPGPDGMFGFGLWRDALFGLVTQTKNSALISETEAIVSLIFDFVPYGWNTRPPHREPLTDQALATRLARLAFLHPAALSLVSAPTVPSLQQALDNHGGPTLTDPRDRLEQLTARATDFAPDPLWLAWFTTAQTDFCQAVRNLAAPAPIAPPPIPTPKTTSLAESILQKAEQAAEYVEGLTSKMEKKSALRKPAPKKA